MTFTLSLVLTLFLLSFQQGQTGSEERERMRRVAETAAEKHRQKAIRLNDLSGNIRTEADAQRLVDSVAEMLADHLPPHFTTASLRHRVGAAEYKAATNPAALIPEERLAKVWSEYISEIGADKEARATSKELHSLRDLKHTYSKLWWSRGSNQTIWTMPNIYAVSPDGKLASGCRVLEALAILYEMDSRFDNLRTARKIANEGVLASERLREAEERERSSDNRQRVRIQARLEVRVDQNPVHLAERRYIADKGITAMYALLDRLSNELIPE